jgi:hypothetical protein
MVLSIFGRITKTKWYVADDHEIMLYVGPDRKLPTSEIFATLSLTEIGNFGSIKRFRPTYYTLRITESAFCGLNPACWYRNRLVLLLFGISLTWILLLPRFGWIGGGVLCAYILTFAYWVDIIGRLGPGESYAVLGLPLYIWGVVNAFQQDDKVIKQIIAGLALLLGSVICIGSKENFLLLIFPSVFVAFKAFQAKRYYLLSFALSSVAFAFFVGVAVLLLLSQSEGDFYANSTSPLVRLNILLDSMLSESNFLPIGILFGLIIALTSILFVRSLSSDVKKVISQTVFWLVTMIFIYCSQLIFYNGTWPVGNRYDFPGILYIPATVYLLYLLAEEVLSGGNIRLSKQVVRAIFISALSLVVLSKGYAPIIRLLEEYKRSTNEFTNRVDAISTSLKQKQDYALIIESTSAWDYEPVYGYGRFLRTYGAENPFFLRIRCYSPETMVRDQEDPLAIDLALQLNEISTQGNDLFTPLSRLEDYQNRCFLLELSDSTFRECPSQDSVQAECLHRK